MSLPTAQDVMEYLQGYCLDTLEVVKFETITVDSVNDIITVGGGYDYTTGDMVRFTAVTAIPAPFVLGVTYFLIEVTPTTFRVANSRENATDGIYIDITSSGTGTVTMSEYDYSYIDQAWIEKRMSSFIVPYVEKVTRQSFSGVKSVTEYYSGNGRNILLLNRRPIVALTEIRYVLGNNNLTILNLNNIEVVNNQGILKAKRNYEESYYLPVFAKGDYNLKVTYTYGYTVVPEPIKEAIIYLSAEQLLGFVGARTGGGSISMQGFSRTYGNRGKYSDIRNDLARQAQNLLAPYRTSVVGS